MAPCIAGVSFMFHTDRPGPRHEEGRGQADHFFGPLAPWLEADLNASLARRIINQRCMVMTAHPWGLGSNLIELWWMVTMAQATQPELELYYNHQPVRSKKA